MNRIVSYLLLAAGVVLVVVGVEASHIHSARALFGLRPDSAVWTTLAVTGGFLALLGLTLKVRRFYAAVSLERDIPRHLDLAEIYYLQRELPQAIAEYRHVLRLQPDCVEALNNLAFLLATAADESLRDGPEAVRLAEQAARLPQIPGMCVAGTLAAAYAEAGRFPEAIATAEKAYQDESAAGKGRFAALNWQFLTLYRAHQPWHGTTATPGTPCLPEAHDFFPALPHRG